MRSSLSIGAWLGTWALLVIATAWPATAAQQLHVSPAGDDSNSGTEASPLRTLAAAVGLAEQGDSVILHAGTYREGPLVVARGGTSPDRPLVIQAADGAEVVLKGSDVVSGWEPAANAKGLWKKANWPTNSQQLFADGQPVQQVGVASPLHTTVGYDQHMCLRPMGKGLADMAPGRFYYDAGAHALYCMLADSSDPNRHQMEASVRDRLLDGNGQSYVTLRHLSFMHGNGTAQGAWASLVQVSGKGWVVEDCTFAWGDFAGMTVSGEDHVIRRSRFPNNGDEGIGINGSDAAHNYARYLERPPMNIVLEDLTISGNNYRRFYTAWHAGGIKVIPSIRALTIRRCEVRDNRGPGIWLDGCLGANRIEDNLVVGNEVGIHYEICVPVEGDQFGAVIRNNRVIANAYQGIYVSASQGAIVENNTCYNNQWDIVLHGMPRHEFGEDLKLKGNTVRNNIVCGRNTDLAIFAGPGAEGNTVDGNFYASCPPGPQKGAAFSASRDSGYVPTQHDVKAVFQQTGFEEHGQSGDPLWANPQQMDFRLKAGSPAAGKGWQPSAN